MNAQPTIRTSLHPGDIGYITYMHGKLYEEEYQYGMAHERYVAAGLVEFYDRYDPTHDRVWIAEDQGIIVGSLFLVDRGKEAQLRYFLIDPAYRGLGLGKKLLELFLKAVRESGYESAYLLTIHELKAAAALYLRAGFKLTSETPSTALGRPLIEQRYDLKLK